MENEKRIQSEIALEYNKAGTRLLRNNIGVAEYKNGAVVRYGVGGVGGSDFIGLNKITITPEMVGKQVAIFCAVEVKRPQKKPTPQQLRFLEMVASLGGIAGVATCTDDIKNLFDNYLNSLKTN